MGIKEYTFVLLMATSLNLFCQSDIAIGTWKSYLPYNQGQVVTQNQKMIIYGTNFSLVTIDKEDFSTEFISTVDGLSESGIQDIEFDLFNDQLIIAYTSGLIDIVRGMDVFPVLDIRDNRNILGDKTIYDMFVADDRFVYLATGFGIVQYNLLRREFGFTTFTNTRVHTIASSGSRLIIATEESSYFIDLETAINPSDFNAWMAIDDRFGLPETYESQSLLALDGDIYIAADNIIYRGANDLQFEEVLQNPYPDYHIQFINSTPEGWMLGLRDPGSRSKILFFDAQDIMIHEENACVNRLRDAIVDEAGRLWIADEWDEFRYFESIGSGCQRLNFNGPRNEEASDIAIEDNIVYVASGGVSDAFGYLFGRNGFYILEGGTWTNINESNNEDIKANDLLMLYQVLPDPKSDWLYVGSYWGGLMAYNTSDESFQLFDKDNSSLQGALGDEQRTRISGLAFDDDDNLWISNFGSERPLSVKTANDTWHSFPILADNRLSQITIDPLGYKWIVIGGNSGGLYVYDSGESPEDPTDDRERFFNLNNSEIPSNFVNCVAVDLDGGVWVGTGEGAVVFECGISAFEDICVGNRRPVLQDSIFGYLLESEDVRAIAVDGANRKWFGTRNGIFVQSPNGEDQVARFSTDNSPLFDNNIRDLAYNDETGEMIIATSKGILSYRTETTGGRRVHGPSVYAFPNPVRPEYDGPIAIKGLARDANVKITDLNGTLVYETTSLGGQAIWYGTDPSGRKVTSGVYLVFSSTTDNFSNPNTYVTKIMVIR